MLEATPADHFLMRIITALATSRVLRQPLLRFYAASSGAPGGGVSGWVGAQSQRGPGRCGRGSKRFASQLPPCISLSNAF